MPRPRKDGSKAAAPERRKLSVVFLRRVKPRTAPFAVWDSYQRGLCLLIQPTGHKAFKAVYHHHGRPRWVHIGDANAISLAGARKIAGKIMVQAADGQDPLAERQAEKRAGTFAELADRYLEEEAKIKNKSWKQARALVERELLPRWGKMKPAQIKRADVKVMMGKIEAKIAANQTLAAASAIFSWAIKQDIITVNPCSKVDRNATKSRERVLSESEIPRFWAAFDTIDMVRSLALKTTLVTGQRPGEVSSMRHEHLVDGWWEMPGEVIEGIWPGTKNRRSHRVWLPQPAWALIAEMYDGERPSSGFVFPSAHGRAANDLDVAMRDICKAIGAPGAVPHDLRRTHGTTVTKLGLGRHIMDLIQNHKKKGVVTDTYDRYAYGPEIKNAMERVAARIVALANGETPADDEIDADDKLLAFAARQR